MAAMLLLMVARGAAAAETWTEVKGAHFTAWSNAGDRQARDLLWQLEQIRFAVSAVWPWAQVDVAKPLLVLVVKDEQGMKALAPRYWEVKGGVRPVTVWVTGADRHYMVMRTDLRNQDDIYVNPFTSSYFSYVSLILNVSFDRDLPLWFSRGVAGVLSNTIVRDTTIYVGAPIPWHIEKLRAEPRWQLKRLLAVTRSSPDYTREEGQRQLDAESWAFLHFLMFGGGGAWRAKVNKYVALLNGGARQDTAFAEAFGTLQDVEHEYFAYAERALFSFQKLTVDKAIKKEQFTSRPLAPAEAAAARAAFHVAMQRPVEARALIDEAHRADPNSGDAYVAEGLLLEREGKREEAKASYVKATQAGATTAYAYYRAAMLTWEAPGPDEATLKQIESNLARALELNPSFASACAGLAEVRAALKQSPAQIVPLLQKAVALDPGDPWVRISAARALWRMNELPQARKVAQIAQTLAQDDERARAEAQRLLSMIPEK
jgi:tetratricopeptide (TPR) repeat protein